MNYLETEPTHVQVCSDLQQHVFLKLFTVDQTCFTDDNKLLVPQNASVVVGHFETAVSHATRLIPNIWTVELKSLLLHVSVYLRLFVCRCLASETECDKLRERANELRRKVDDTQAALLELGRENQSLQVTTPCLKTKEHQAHGNNSVKYFKILVSMKTEEDFLYKD